VRKKRNKNEKNIDTCFPPAVDTECRYAKINDQKLWSDAAAQVKVLLQNVNTEKQKQFNFPRSVVHDTLKLVPSNDWTSGFWPGMLWFMYQHSNSPEWLTTAKNFTSLMIREPWNRNSHDVGFKVYNSYGNGYKLTSDTAYRRLIIEGARTLCTRFNPVTGCIRSWDFGKWQYPVIIDNMMNLELLFEATKLSGDSTFYRVAVSHANTTMKNHFRPDNSCYHVVDYDTVTGVVRGRGTLQGYSDESVWARGQAWALYGYTMCYRETHNPAYLQQAERVATFLLNDPRLPKDKIPYWDFSVPNLLNEPRDASAAAIIASALYELKNYSSKGNKYEKAANAIIYSLSRSYRAKIGSNHGFLLQHSTGHKPVNSEVDGPLIYADYYFLEALLRKTKGL
jgi:unsaturated chondroitin disaccharide hydrolase